MKLPTSAPPPPWKVKVPPVEGIKPGDNCAKLEPATPGRDERNTDDPAGLLTLMFPASRPFSEPLTAVELVL